MGTRASLLDFAEPLQNLNFSLIKSFFHCRKFVFELFDGKDLASCNMLALVHIAKTATTNEFSSFVLIVDD